MMSGSIMNPGSGPASFASEDGHSFIVLDRETVEDRERLENELVDSMRAVSVGPGGVVSNHFGEAPPTSLRDVEVPVHISNGLFSLPVDVQARMDSLIQENLNLQVTVDQTNASLREMMGTLGMWRGDMEKVRQEHKEKFQETRVLVMALKKEKAELRSKNEALQAKVEELERRGMPSLFEEIVPSVNELELKSAVDDLQSQLNIALAERDAHIEKNGIYVEEISSLKTDMIALKNQLKQLETLKKEVDSSKAEFKTLEMLQKAESEELKGICEENRRLKNDLANLSSVGRHSQDYQVAQAKGFTNKIDELTAKLMCTEEQLQKAHSEIAQLQESSGGNDTASAGVQASVDRLRLRIDDMTSQIVELEEKNQNQTRQIATLEEQIVSKDEAVEILKLQVDVYRADFVAERDSRERLAGEKEQLAVDFRRLHQHNIELDNQLQELKTRANTDTPRNQDQPENVEGEGDQPDSTYRCPICNSRTFRTLQAVNEHIDRCLGGFTDIP